MSQLKRLFSVPTWMRMRLAGTQIANLYTHLNVWVYRASKGKLWGHLYVPDTRALMPILLLETHGRRTGKSRVTPLIYCKREGGFLLAAANAGHGRDPGWFLNLRSDASVHISLGGDRFPALAMVVPPDDRDAAFSAFATAYPPLLRYQAATSRRVPMVFVKPAPKLGSSQPPQ